MTTASYVTEYESDSDEENIQNTQILKKKQRLMKRSRNWLKDQVFKTKDEAITVINNEGQLSYHYSNKTSEGKKTYYRCNKSKFRGEQCDASIYLRFVAENEDIILFRAIAEHTHHKNIAKFKLSQNIKEEINKLLEINQKPKAILQSLHENGFEAPNKAQLRNYISKYKNEKYGRSSLSMGELEQSCLDKNSIPDSDDTAFIVNYFIQYNDEFDDNEDVCSDNEETNSIFRIFISIKRLMKTASKSTKFHADATYKLTWKGFPILLIGTSDFDRHFHVIGFSICTNEKKATVFLIFLKYLEFSDKILRKIN